MNDVLDLMRGFKVQPMTVSSIMEKAVEYQLELSPPYQRDVIWSNKYQSDLVSSIFMGFPIGSLTFVETPTGYIVLDGKQRISSVIAFREGKISSSEGYSYKEMCTSNDPEVKHKLSKFKDYFVQVVIFPDMSDKTNTIDPNGWLRQRNIFMRINQGQNLGSQERIYCDNFLARRLMEWVYSKSVIKLKPMLKGAEHKEQRYSHLRYTQNLLVLAFGKTLVEQSVEVLGSLTDIIKPCTNQLQERLISLGYRDGSAFDEDLLKRLGIHDNIKLFERVCDVLSQILSYDPSYKKWTNTVVRDIVTYCLKKCSINVLTPSQLSVQQKQFFDVFKEFGRIISTEKLDLGRGTNSGPVVRKRLDILESCVEKSGFDMSPKNVAFSSKEKMQAYLASDGCCPLCGRVITDENSAVDHVEPKSMSGNKIPVVICKPCNLRKSNWTKDELERYHKFVDDHTK